MQTNKNLMMEIEKIRRVSGPDLVLFVGDALAGNDVLAQAQEFDKFVNINGAVLTKIDADAKGGAAISISYVTKKPILFLGCGQNYDDIRLFEPEIIISNVLN